MVDFLETGCLAEYVCGTVKKPENGHTLSPWVKCTFRNGSAGVITVGNLSSPSMSNSATIKSFDFGIADGSLCKVVIHDTQGSSLHDFIQSIMKQLKKVEFNTDRIFEIEWGWTKSGCPRPDPANKSDKHYMLFDSIETNFVQGKFIHEITGTDTMKNATDGGVEKNIGGDLPETALPLKTALKQLLTEAPFPIVKTVAFKRINPSSGKAEDVGFEFSDEGPVHVWRGNSSNKLEVARNWVRGHRTKNKKIFILRYNTTVDGGEVIFWESPVVRCSEIVDPKLCIGTYVVNGGKISPVIEFNPKIKWDFSTTPTMGGNLHDHTIQKDASHKGDKAMGVIECPQLKRPESGGEAGQVLSTSVTQAHKDLYNDDATPFAQRAQAQSLVEDGIYIKDNGIEADMTIVGDPKLPTAKDGVIGGLFVGIAFVNPFHFTDAPQGGCGEWIPQPACNKTLSNSGWQVKRLNHRISDGTYTTIFSLHLPVPGYDLVKGAPAGGTKNGDNFEGK